MISRIKLNKSMNNNVDDSLLNEEDSIYTNQIILDDEIYENLEQEEYNDKIEKIIKKILDEKNNKV